MIPGTFVRRAKNRLDYGPVEEPPAPYKENPLFYRQLVEEMDDVTGYVSQEDTSSLLQYLGSNKERVDGPVDGATAFDQVENILGDMSGEDRPFEDIDFSVTYRDQGDRRHIQLDGLQKHSLFEGDRYRVELAGRA